MKYPRYPEYKESGIEWIGEIPEHWKLIPLTRLLTIQKGKVPQTMVSESPISDYYLPYLSMNYLRGGEATQWVTKVESNLMVTKDEVLLLWDGSNAGEFIKSRYGILSSTIAWIKSSKLGRNFLFFLCKSFENILRGLTVGMGIPHVDAGVLKSIVVPIPPEVEQIGIGDYLEEEYNKIDHLISIHKSIIQLLKEKRLALITHAVTKGLDPNVSMKDSGIEWIGKIPEHWILRRLKYNVNLLTKKAERQTQQVALENIESWSGKYIFSEAKFEAEGVSFEPGDILFGKLRPYLAKVYLAEFSGEAVGDFYVLRPAQGFNGKFLSYQLLNRIFIDFVDSSTYGAKMPRVSWNFMGNIQMVTPPKNEQISIARFVERESKKIDSLVSRQQQIIELLNEHKSSLITHAITGKIDVRGLVKEVNRTAGQTA